MLGYVNNQIAESSPAVTVVPGKNPHRVNLKPWDMVVSVPVSKLHPDGKARIPAATQEDFKTILAASPGEERFIKELNTEQERIYKASLMKNCLWYQEQNGGKAEEKTNQKPITKL